MTTPACEWHGVEDCRLCKRPKPVTKQRKGLKTNRRLGDRTRELASTYSHGRFRKAVFAMHGEKCWLATVFDTPCDEFELDACHVIPKNHLTNVFEKGAVLLGDFATPYEGESEIPAGAKVVTLDAILLDARNGLPCCRDHHTQAGDTWSGVDFAHFPKCVSDFTTQYRISWLAGVEGRKVR